MSDQPILSLSNNNAELLACRVLEKYGIKTVNDLRQFISENNGSWEELIGRLKGMSPTRMKSVKEMVKREGLLTTPYA